MISLALLFGGQSSEHEVSICSAMGVFQNLDKKKYDITLIGITRSGKWRLVLASDFLTYQDRPREFCISEEGPDFCVIPFGGTHHSIEVVFNLIHGKHGEDGSLQGLFEVAHIAYVGSGVLSSAVGMDKDISKRLFQNAFIPVVPWLTAHRFFFEANPDLLVEQAQSQFGYPYFVKPARSGSSVGVFKVKTADQAKTAFEKAFQWDSKILIEMAIDARECECAVLGNQKPRPSKIGEILPQHEFYSYEAKYLDPQGAKTAIPADMDPKILERIQELAVLAYQTIECKGLARVDFFVDKKNQQIYLNEINTLPGFTKISMYPQLWEKTGISYTVLLDELITLAQKEHLEKKQLHIDF
jgi:D-alanine-D-alanine ligase